ncbi:hypothetical protein ACHAWF_010710 [Thalassiosira exigua]
MISSLVLTIAILFPSGRAAGGSDGGRVEDAYESKIQQALSIHASESPDLLQRSLNVGGGATVEVGADGNVAETNGGAYEKFMSPGAKQYADSDDEEESGDSSDDDEDEDDESLLAAFREHYPDDYRLTKDLSLKVKLDAIEDEEERLDEYKWIRAEAFRLAQLDPEDWEYFSYWELHTAFRCDRIMAERRPIYGPEVWTEIRELYHEFVRDEKEEGQPGTYQFSDIQDPLMPMEPFQSTEKGRSLRATRDISKGEIVFQATNNTIIFTEGDVWRKFLFVVYERNGRPFDKETACDILIWSWVQRLEEDGPLVIVMDLDNGSLLNEGRDEEDWDPPNVQCGEEGAKFCGMDYYATRDMKAGEEILINYHSFAILDGWKAMGL